MNWMILLLSTHVKAADYPDMESKLIVSFGVTEIKDWDGTENANSGKLVWNFFLFKNLPK